MIPSGHPTGSLRGVALGDESAAAVGTKPAAKSSRSCHRTCRRNLCEIEARPVEQRFAIAAACTDAEASNYAASTVINNFRARMAVHLRAHDQMSLTLTLGNKLFDIVYIRIIIGCQWRV